MDNHQVKVAVTLGLVVASSTIIGIELDSSWLGIAAFYRIP